MSRLSAFDIPRRPEQLKSANEGFANAHYRQISATKDVTGNQFSQGVQQFRFDTAGTTWFMPSMSYFRLRCTLRQVREDGGEPLPILSNADLAPNMGLAANLFKSVELRLNGHTVERISERLPQIDALKTRLGNTSGWLDQLGKTTNFWDSNFASRRECVAVDGYAPTQGTATPHYGNPLTQKQAGFHENHLLRYSKTTGLLECTHNNMGPIDIQHGPMALRPGDRVSRGEAVLEIAQVVDATRALCKPVAVGTRGTHSIHGGAAQQPTGVNGWFVQKVSSAHTNKALGKNQFEIVWRPPLGFLTWAMRFHRVANG